MIQEAKRQLLRAYIAGLESESHWGHRWATIPLQGRYSRIRKFLSFYQSLKFKNMDQASHMKLMAAGFRILRTDDQPSLRIKVKENGNDWRTLEKFETKAARERKFKELLTDSKTLQD